MHYSLHDNATPGHCVLCGIPNARNLCRRCMNAHSIGGELPPWLRELQRLQDNTHKKERANAERAVKRPVPKFRKKRGRGRPQSYGVTFIPYDRAFPRE